MTADNERPSVLPPSWAVALLALLLPPDETETVTGDLIEEYRDTVYAASGQWRADAWFVRQVAGFAWHTAVAWGLLLAAFLSGRFLLDTFAPPASYYGRSFVTTWSSILLYLLAAAWASRRTGRARTGTLVAVGAHAIGWIMSAAITAIVFIGVIRNEPAMLNLFQETGGWGEQWFLPLMLLPFVLFLGSVGGVCGRSLAKRSRA
jgi:cation transport ATPase